MNRFSSIAALTAILLTAAACGDDSSRARRHRRRRQRAVGHRQLVAQWHRDAVRHRCRRAGDRRRPADYPVEALAKPHDLSGYEPNVEAIAALAPDLVVLSDPTIQPQLEALGIAVWVGSAPTTFDDVYAQIEQLGAATALRRNWPSH